MSEAQPGPTDGEEPRPIEGAQDVEVTQPGSWNLSTWTQRPVRAQPKFVLPHCRDALHGCLA